MSKAALLVLEDGRAFAGTSYGATGETFGEAVFTTGMTGYQETLTDPSYHRQIVTQTAPHIGNTGVNDEDDESQKIWVAGYVVRDPARVPSNRRATGDLGERLAAEGVVGISDVDTRALTRHLRERGAMRAGISTEILDPAALLEKVLQQPVAVVVDAGHADPHRAALAQVPGQRPGVHAADADDALGREPLTEVAGRAPVGRAAGRVADHVAGDPDPVGLVILGVDAGVADLRRGLHHDLPVVGRVGQRLLIAGHAGGEHGLTERLAGRAVGLTDERPPVLEHEDR